MATLYYVIGPAAGWSDPSASQVKAGQLAGGSAATATGSETARTTTGEQVFGSAASGLSQNTSYRVAFVWSNGSTDSSVVVSEPFATATSDYPSVLSRTTGATTTNGTAHTITLPTHEAGDLLAVVFGNDGSASVSINTGSSSAGWRIENSTVAGTTVCRGTVIWKVCASASETLALTTSATEQASWVIYRIADGGYVEVAAANNDGSTASVNPPSLTASHGSDGNLWIAASVRDGSQSSPTSTPASYSNLQHIAGSGGANVTVNAMERQLVAATEDPGTFSGGTNGVGVTLCVRPQAYPFVRGTPISTTVSSNVTSLSVTLPAHVAGDTLVVVVGSETSPSVNTGSSSSGWQSSVTNNGANSYSGVFYLPSAAAAGSTLTLSQASGFVAAIAYAIGAGGAVTLASATGSSTSADPPSIAQPTNPKALYLAAYAGASGSTVPTVSAYPSGYLVPTEASSTGADSARVYAAELASSSPQDAGAFTLSGTFGWVTWAIAVEQVATATGTADQSVPAFTQSAVGAALVAATASQTVPDFTGAAAGVAVVTATASQTVPAFEQSAAGTVVAVLAGSADQTVPAFDQTAAGAVRAAGAADQTVPAFTQSGAGAATVTGAASQTVPDFGQSASGALGNTITGSAAQVVPDFSQSASGVVLAQASASQAVPAFDQSATGAVLVQATASQTIPDFGQSASGVQGEVSTGTADQTIPAFGSTAAGSVRAAASASQEVPAFTQVVQAAARVVAQAAQQVEAFIASAEGDVLIAAQAVQNVLAFAQSAAGTVGEVVPLPEFPASIVFYLPPDGASFALARDGADFTLSADDVGMELTE